MLEREERRGEWGERGHVSRLVGWRMGGRTQGDALYVPAWVAHEMAHGNLGFEPGGKGARDPRAGGDGRAPRVRGAGEEDELARAAELLEGGDEVGQAVKAFLQIRAKREEGWCGGAGGEGAGVRNAGEPRVPPSRSGHPEPAPPRTPVLERALAIVDVGGGGKVAHEHKCQRHQVLRVAPEQDVQLGQHLGLVQPHVREDYQEDVLSRNLHRLDGGQLIRLPGSAEKVDIIAKGRPAARA